MKVAKDESPERSFQERRLSFSSLMRRQTPPLAPLFGVGPATGKDLDILSIGIMTVAGVKIVHICHLEDWTGAIAHPIADQKNTGAAWRHIAGYVVQLLRTFRARSAPSAALSRGRSDEPRG